MQFNIFKDARYFQLLFQFVFLSYGIYYLHWNAEWWLYTTYISTSLILQYLILAFSQPGPGRDIAVSGAWKSALISSFSLCLLLKTNSFAVAVLASLIMVLSKYLLKINGKHIFNPSALAIAATVWFTGNAWISPGQWGSGTVLIFGVCSLGFIVTTRVQKLDVSLAFLGTFAALVFTRQIIYQGWPLDYFIQSVSTGSLLLFSFFMITDPKTTPNHPAARIIWSMCIAGIAFYLTAFKFINGAPIWVLVMAQPLIPLLDRLFKAKQFEWSPVSLPHFSTRMLTTRIHK
jgi:Na+-transporting NADH:ubiquinone oxidoreductase subunit NqrB